MVSIAPKMRTRAFMMRLNAEVVDELKTLAERYGRASANKVACEIIEQYMEFWQQAEQAKKGVFDHQRSVVLKTAEGALKDSSRIRRGGKSKRRV
jgi:predicted DNA-binding protein